MSTRRGHHLVQRRQVAHAEHRLAITLEADQHAVERYTLDKGLGSIDRVENPAVACSRIGFAVLFTQYGMVRETCLDHRAQTLLGHLVGDRDRRLIGLEFGDNAGTEVAQRDLAGLLGCLLGKVE